MFLQHGLYGTQLRQIILGIDNVFSDYPGFLNSVKYRDMNPYHCFRFDLDRIYNFTDHKCTTNN
jgi:hypothetical protein